MRRHVGGWCQRARQLSALQAAPPTLSAAAHFSAGRSEGRAAEVSTAAAAAAAAARAGAGAGVEVGRRRRGWGVGSSSSEGGAGWRSPWGLVGGKRSFFIQTSTTPNPTSLKFHPGREVLPESHGTGMFFVKGDKDASQSPLAHKLLATEGVQGVFLGREFITVTKQEGEDWALLKPGLFGVIMDFYAEGKPVVLNEPVVSDTTILDDDDEVVAMIKELLEERIRPAVQEDGGDLFYKGFSHDTGIVKLQMAGSCVGCPSSGATLKHGVENMLMHYVPEVTGVEEVVDDQLIDLNKKEADALEEKLRKAGIPHSD